MPFGGVDRIRDSLARTCVFEKDGCFPGLLQVFDPQSPYVDMPWLDTGIESTIGRSQICPGWIQESNLEIVVNRCALAGYRNRIFELLRRALARYRRLVFRRGRQICPC